MITIYSKTLCPNCTHAKKFLEAKEISFQEANIEKDASAREFLLSKGHRSVPQIYVGEQLLVAGGWEALSKLSTEEIQNLVNQLTN